MSRQARPVGRPALAPVRRDAGTRGGDPDRIRTCDPQIRNLMLYPAELRDRRRRRHGRTARHTGLIANWSEKSISLESGAGFRGAGSADRNGRPAKTFPHPQRLKLRPCDNHRQIAQERGGTAIPDALKLCESEATRNPWRTGDSLSGSTHCRRVSCRCRLRGRSTTTRSARRHGVDAGGGRTTVQRANRGRVGAVAKRVPGPSDTGLETTVRRGMACPRPDRVLTERPDESA